MLPTLILTNILQDAQLPTTATFQNGMINTSHQQIKKCVSIANKPAVQSKYVCIAHRKTLLDVWSCLKQLETTALGLCCGKSLHTLSTCNALLFLNFNRIAMALRVPLIKWPQVWMHRCFDIWHTGTKRIRARSSSRLHIRDAVYSLPALKTWSAEPSKVWQLLLGLGFFHRVISNIRLHDYGKTSPVIQ